MKFKSIKGTRDILPAESHRWQYAEQLIRTQMDLFNYREIRTPAFEETALFARGIGELTDIVSKEMYTFIDRSETSLTLKPEMTASVIRAYLQHNLGELQPLTKVFYIAPMFRQERPQAGRLRQFHQFGAEAIGGRSAAIDADVISLTMEIYRSFGVQNPVLKINSVGCNLCRPPYKTLLRKFLDGVRSELSSESQRRLEQNPLRILDSKDANDQKLTAGAPLIKDHLCEECAEHFAELQNSLTLANVLYSVDGRIVRGLDYYTKTAFEITSSDLGSQDALAGGGRYDLLAEELGGKPTPAVRIRRRNRTTAHGARTAEASVPRGERTGGVHRLRRRRRRRWAIRMVMELRRNGISAETDYLARSLKAQMREADRQQAVYATVIGANEISANRCDLKVMKTGEARPVTLDKLPDELKKILPRS